VKNGIPIASNNSASTTGFPPKALQISLLLVLQSSGTVETKEPDFERKLWRHNSQFLSEATEAITSPVNFPHLQGALFPGIRSLRPRC